MLFRSIDDNGQAALVVPNWGHGIHALTARYEGKGQFLPSASNSVVLNVLPASPPRGTASVKGSQLIGWVLDPNAGRKTLQVQVRIDGKLRGRINLPATLSKRSFKWSLPALPIGPHTIEVHAMDYPTGQPVLLARRVVQTGQALFNNRYYLAAYPDATAAIQSGQFASAWDHYVQVGQEIGRASCRERV